MIRHLHFDPIGLPTSTEALDRWMAADIKYYELQLDELHATPERFVGYRGVVT